MARQQLKTLTEPMYYLLLALICPRHGYGAMQFISELTEGRVHVGAGTLYALLARFEAEGIVSQLMERDRKKIYQITPKGAEILTEEYIRINRMAEDGRQFFDDSGSLRPVDDSWELQEVQEAAAERETSRRRQQEGQEKDGAEGQGTAGRKKSDRKARSKGFRKSIFATCWQRG